MKQKEARTLIIREWDRWLQTHSIESGGPTGRDTLSFFFELQDARSPLLDFQSRGRDKWKIIYTWVLGIARTLRFGVVDLGSVEGKCENGRGNRISHGA